MHSRVRGMGGLWYSVYKMNLVGEQVKGREGILYII